MADTLVIGRAFAPGVTGTAKLTTELSSLQTNTTLAGSTPATKIVGAMVFPGVGGVAKLTTELSSLQTNTTLAGSNPATKIVGAMVYPGVGGVQRLSTFVLASAEQIVIRSGPVNMQRWTMG